MCVFRSVRCGLTHCIPSGIAACGSNCAYKYLEVPKTWQCPIQINLPIYIGLAVFEY